MKIKISNSQTKKIFLSFVWILNFSCLFLFSLDRPIKFVPIGVAEGLQASIHCVLQDSRGFIWMGTEAGIYRYDGYTLVNFSPEASNPKSLSNSWVYSIQEDSQGNLWIGTDNGLNLFNRETETFLQYKHDPEVQESLSDNKVFVVYVDSGGEIWFGTQNGLNLFDKEKGTFARFYS